MGSKFSKAIVCLVLLPSLLLGLTACTDEEVGDAVGIIAIGAGVIAICSSDNVDCTHRHYRHRRVRRNYRHCYYDRYGYYRCVDHYRSHMTSLSADMDTEEYSLEVEPGIFEMGTNNIEAQDWATTFSLSEEGSEAIISALESAREGNTDELIALGMTEKDLSRLAQLKMPKESSVMMLSETLGESNESVTKMFKSLLDITKSESKKTLLPTLSL